MNILVIFGDRDQPVCVPRETRVSCHVIPDQLDFQSTPPFPASSPHQLACNERCEVLYNECRDRASGNFPIILGLKGTKLQFTFIALRWTIHTINRSINRRVDPLINVPSSETIDRAIERTLLLRGRLPTLYSSHGPNGTRTEIGNDDTTIL
jgi:hypothetical protein